MSQENIERPCGWDRELAKRRRCWSPFTGNKLRGLSDQLLQRQFIVEPRRVRRPTSFSVPTNQHRLLPMSHGAGRCRGSLRCHAGVQHRDRRLAWGILSLRSRSEGGVALSWLDKRIGDARRGRDRAGFPVRSSGASWSRPMVTSADSEVAGWRQATGTGVRPAGASVRTPIAATCRVRSSAARFFCR